MIVLRQTRLHFLVLISEVGLTNINIDYTTYTALTLCICFAIIVLNYFFMCYDQSIQTGKL